MNSIPRHIFRAYDIRGLLEEVTPEIARQVGMALVNSTKAKTVVVGRDMRATSLDLQRAAMEGINAVGTDVVDIGLCSTSMFNFAVSSQENIQAGVMITASHNPSEYNGIKAAYHTGEPISGIELLDTIDKGVSPSDSVGRVIESDILSSYLDRVCSAVAHDLSGIKIVVDYGNGIGSLSVRPLAQRLGIQLIELFPEPDASFPNHEPNPAIESNLETVKETIAKEKADFGIALDGDADRIGFIDNEGNALRGDQMLAFFAKDLCAREHGAKIIVSPNQSWITCDTIRESGGEPVEIRIGRTFVIKAMHEQGAAIGGEVSSHFFFREFGGLESVDYALVKAIEIWKQSGMTFADFTRDLRRYANSWEVNLKVQDKDAALKAINGLYVSKASLVNKLDGVRCEFDRDWWFIVRPSNTEPLLRLTVEATSEELMREKRDELIALIKSSV